jgi:deoxyadenosine/deoxycytidine kinase
LCVSIDGNISCGKSTLIATLAEDEVVNSMFDQVILRREPIKPKALDIYLSDRDQYAFSFQIVTAVKRVQLYRDAKRLMRKHPRTLFIFDRGINGDRAFAKMQLDNAYFSDNDYSWYNEEIGVTDGSLQAILSDPQFKMVYLECKPETAFRRLQQRGNKAEVDAYTVDYFVQLDKAHEAMFEGSQVARVNWEDDRLVSDKKLSAADVKYFLEKAGLAKE